MPLSTQYAWHAQAQERLKLEHQSTAVVINKVNLFLKNETISVNVSKLKAYVLLLLFSLEFINIYILFM